MYDEPCLRYKIACCKTVFLHKRMVNGDEADDMVELDLNNAVTKEHAGLFMYTLTDEDIANL